MQFVDFAPVKLVFGPGRLEGPSHRAPARHQGPASHLERPLDGAHRRARARHRHTRGTWRCRGSHGRRRAQPDVSTVMKVAARMKDRDATSSSRWAAAPSWTARRSRASWRRIPASSGTTSRAVPADAGPSSMIRFRSSRSRRPRAPAAKSTPAASSPIETREKVGIGHPGCFPKLAIVDPELMVSVPPALTAYQGFDALFHAVEGYVGKRPNFMSDMYALEAVRHLAAVASQGRR